MSALRKWFEIFITQFTDYGIIKNDKRTSKENGHVLIMKMDAIGDFIIFLDSARAYRDVFPDKRIVLLCSRICKPLAEKSGCFDECITEDELNGRGFEILVQPVFAKTRRMDVLAASIPAHRKISVKPDTSKLNLSRKLTLGFINRAGDRIYDTLLDTDEELKMDTESFKGSRTMELIRNAAFIRKLGKKDFRASVPEFPVSDVEEALFPSEGYYVIFPGASSKRKSWEPARYAAVIDFIHKKCGKLCLICGSDGEKHIYDEIMGAVKAVPQERVLDYMGKTSLIELMEVIRRADFLIGNDTSGVHFAAVTGTRSLCILGDFLYGRFMYCALKRRSLSCMIDIATRNQFSCIRDISVKEVTDAIDDHGLLEMERT